MRPFLKEKQKREKNCCELIRSQKNISLDVQGVTTSKSLWSYFEILNNCQNFFLLLFYFYNKYTSFYQLYTDGSKNEYGSEAVVFDPLAKITLKFRFDVNISIMHIEIIAILEALSLILSYSNKKLLFCWIQKAPTLVKTD